ncbi:GNAT family N-acetyltransferase [Enterococcus sp. LJL99]
MLGDTISYLKAIEGLEQVNLTLNSTNRAVIKLYTEFGFENLGYKKNALKFKNDYYNENWMVLKLK